MKDFVHLHNHTEYSLLDGATKIKDMIQYAQKYNMKHLAITDHGNLHGIIEFYKECKAANINGIIGIEVYVAQKSRHDKTKKIKGDPEKSDNHLILLAKNLEGYHNLIKLSSLAYLEGYYYRPRIDEELLERYHSGLICSTACLAGKIPQAILNDDYNLAVETAGKYQEIFGKGNFYLELQNHFIPEQQKVNKNLIKMSKELNIPLIATNDIHYIKKEHAIAQEILLCIQRKTTLEENKFRFANDQFYFKSPDEMYELFSEIPEALSNTLQVAEKCNLKLELGKPNLPKFKIPKEFESDYEYLEYLTYQGAHKRYGNLTDEIKKRIEMELKTIKETGFVGYFLIVQDFTNTAKKMGISVGPGRGSAAGSIVSYCIGITDIDPLKYNLLFERFLNLERVSMPDIDIDFSDTRRADIIKYVKRKYGEDSVCQIATFNVLKAKSVIRDVGRVLGIPLSKVDKLAKLVPNGPKVKLAEVYENDKDFQELINSDEEYTKLYENALTLEGITRNTGVHAAGVIIAPGNLMNYAPVFRASDKEDVILQFPKEPAEEIGLLKMDFLGLRTLTLIEDTLTLIKKKYKIDLDLSKIPENDKKTFEMFGRGDTIGVFQFESKGMREYMKKLQPDSLDDLIAMNALYRPGPMAYIDTYINRKHGKEEVTYDHPILEPILRSTYGVIVYQEQVMEIVQKMANFSLGKADILRRAMGKKKRDELMKQKEEFINGCIQNNISPDIAETVFSKMEDFANYAFNKSHSAGYAVLAYRTAYLKANYPKEFFAASLSSVLGNTDKVILFRNNCEALNIKILPPDINESNYDFTPVDNGIRYGLGAIKNVGKNAVENIIKAREKGKFLNIFDFCKRIDLNICNKRVLESLILSGATDSLEGNRNQKLSVLPQAMLYSQKISSNKTKFKQNSIFSLNDSLETQLYKLPDIEEIELEELLRKEKELTGFYFSSHPLDLYKTYSNILCKNEIKDIENANDNDFISFLGIISEVSIKTREDGKKYAKVNIEDKTGMVEVFFYNDKYNNFSDLLIEDKIIFFAGSIFIKKIENEEEDEEEVEKRFIQPIFVADIENMPDILTPNIKINLKKGSYNINLLEDYLKKNKISTGKSKVKFCYMSDYRNYDFKSNFRISINDKNLSILSDIFGNNNILLDRIDINQDIFYEIVKKQKSLIS